VYSFGVGMIRRGGAAARWQRAIGARAGTDSIFSRLIHAAICQDAEVE